MSTKAIERFLQTAYSDEKLVALLAHAEDGKLVFTSCCCLIGIPTADHALQGSTISHPKLIPHYRLAKELQGAREAETEFMEIGFRLRDGEDMETVRRAVLIPMIHAEIARRDALRTQDGRDTRDNSCSQELAGVLTR